MDQYPGIEVVDNFAPPVENPNEDRITAILQKRAQPAPQMVNSQEFDAYGIGNVASGQGPQAFLDTINNLQRTRQQDYYAQQDRELSGAQAMYQMFEDKRARGDKQAEAVGKALSNITADPEAQGRLLEWLHKLPEQVDAGNPNKLLMLLARGKRELGIQTDFERTEQDRQIKNKAQEALASQRANGGSGGGTTMAVFKMLEEQYPEADKMTLLRIAQNKVGTNLNIDPTSGTVADMTGAADSLGNLKFGETLGSQNAKIKTEAEISRQSEIGKASGVAEGANVKKEVNAPQIINLIDNAEAILPQATSGGISAIGAKAKSAVGASDSKTQADAQLDVISAALLNNVPRMEGPQSDADRISYEKAAGDLGNRAKPAGDRAAALKVIRALQQKYMTKKPGGVIHFDDLPD